MKHVPEFSKEDQQHDNPIEQVNEDTSDIKYDIHITVIKGTIDTEDSDLPLVELNEGEDAYLSTIYDDGLYSRAEAEAELTKANTNDGWMRESAFGDDNGDFECTLEIVRIIKEPVKKITITLRKEDEEDDDGPRYATEDGNVITPEDDDDDEYSKGDKR